jgi:hypothetical protein
MFPYFLKKHTQSNKHLKCLREAHTTFLLQLTIPVFMHKRRTLLPLRGNEIMFSNVGGKEVRWNFFEFFYGKNYIPTQIFEGAVDVCGPVSWAPEFTQCTSVSCSLLEQIIVKFK